MTEYYDRFVQQVAAYEAYKAFIAGLQNQPANVRMMGQYFNKDLYLDTQPVVPPLLTIKMTNRQGVSLYSPAEQADINNIFNFFGGRGYSIGRAFYDFCIYYIPRFNEGLINTIADIKTEYGIP
jgi:hypothetical protein